MAVKGKSPSYLHLFPHSSAGDRGGFSKPGGKLTSITLVSPFLKVFEQMFGVLMCLTLWYEEEKRLIYMNTSENLGDFFFFPMPETISLGYLVYNSVSDYGLTMSF